MVKSKGYQSLEIDDDASSVKAPSSSIFSKYSLHFLWGFLVVVIMIVLLQSQNAGEGIPDKEFGSSVGSAGKKNKERGPPQAAGHDTSCQHECEEDKFLPEFAPKRYHNASFPGMNDTNTTLECCSARIIVELERHFSQNLPPPFTTLQFDNSNRSSMCGSVIESVENYPGCCELPSSFTKDKNHSSYFGGGTTIPEWIEYCISSNDYYRQGKDRYADANMTGFMVYYDWCPAYLLWDKRSCHNWINQMREAPGEIVQNISLVDGEFTGMVMVRNNTFGDPWNGTSIFIPDVFDSCWQVDCRWGNKVSTHKCIQFAQDNLRRVSLAHYVDTIKDVMCE